MLSPSKPILALQTLRKIDEYLERDQGRSYRGLLRETMPLAEDAYRTDDTSGFRSHLGASFIGRDCSRELWYTFRWATVRKEQGRLLRLFNRGHIEEARFVALLRMIECEVWQHDEAHRQFRVSSLGGHFGGSLDAVIRGCPDVAGGVPILGEFKTHGDKSFSSLAGSDWNEFLAGKAIFSGQGVRSAKFEHFIQMQCYMKGYGLPCGLYLAVNKNDDSIYAEILPYDPEQAERYYDRGRLIVLAEQPPPKINPSPGWYKCKFCDHRTVCHFNGEAARNCRTCVHSLAEESGYWICKLHSERQGNKVALLKEHQLAGCPEYRWNPM